jgi:hypothetical protein
MAFSPCALHKKMYKGGASTFFIAAVDGRDRVARRAQLCPDCSTITLDDMARSLQKVTEGDEVFDIMDPTECTNCGAPFQGEGTQIFVSAYPRGKKELQMWGKFCSACRVFLVDQWALA